MEEEPELALRAACGCVLVTPSEVENNEKQLSSGLFVAGDVGPAKVYRGVVVDVGEGVREPLLPGHLLHYNHYNVIGDHHVVPAQHILAFEDDE